MSLIFCILFRDQIGDRGYDVQGSMTGDEDSLSLVSTVDGQKTASTIVMHEGSIHLFSADEVNHVTFRNSPLEYYTDIDRDSHEISCFGGLQRKLYFPKGVNMVPRENIIMIAPPTHDYLLY